MHHKQTLKVSIIFFIKIVHSQQRRSSTKDAKGQGGTSHQKFHGKLSLKKSLSFSSAQQDTALLTLSGHDPGSYLRPSLTPFPDVTKGEKTDSQDRIKNRMLCFWFPPTHCLLQEGKKGKEKTPDNYNPSKCSSLICI